MAKTITTCCAPTIDNNDRNTMVGWLAGSSVDEPRPRSSETFPPKKRLALSLRAPRATISRVPIFGQPSSL